MPRINKKQEVALWILGLAWSFGLFWIGSKTVFPELATRLKRVQQFYDDDCGVADSFLANPLFATH